MPQLLEVLTSTSGLLLIAQIVVCLGHLIALLAGGPPSGPASAAATA